VVETDFKVSTYTPFKVIDPESEVDSDKTLPTDSINTPTFFDFDPSALNDVPLIIIFPVLL
jgi:hypothetical protein